MTRLRNKVGPEQLSLPFDAPDVPEQDVPQGAPAVTVAVTLPVNAAMPAAQAAPQAAIQPAVKPASKADRKKDAKGAKPGKPEARKRPPLLLSGHVDPAWERNKNAILKMATDNDIRGILQLGTYDAIRGGSYYSTYRCISRDVLDYYDTYAYSRSHNYVPCRSFDFKHVNRTSDNKEDFKAELDIIYVMDNAETVRLPLTVKFEINKLGDHKIAHCISIKPDKDHAADKVCHNVIFLQDEQQIRSALEAGRPYVAKWLSANPLFNVFNYVQAPWLEILQKAGYAIAENILLTGFEHVREEYIDMYNRLFHPGSNPRDIFKTSKAVYSVLKDDPTITMWDTFRRMEKTGRIKEDTVQLVYDGAYSEKQLSQINSILAKHYHGKPVFTWTSLVNYLGRLDMYEAIGHDEALMLLNDYLHMMCNTLDMEPRIDGDSLKREHDVAARLCRNQHDEVIAKRMEVRAELDRKAIEEGDTRLARCDYSEKVYTIRAIRDYADLLDEARQQHNCVASYADRIANGETRIFTMRQTAHPEQSLVTVELSPDFRTIRQKYLARNQQIRNKSMTEFLDRWFRQIHAS